jgi:pimeloyl-ACP methyl ester carboxylesterase
MARPSTRRQHAIIAAALVAAGCSDEAVSGTSGPSATASTGGSGGASNCSALPADFPSGVDVVVEGQLRIVESFPLAGFAPRAVRIYLPAAYDGSTPLPVVYFTDGAWVFTQRGYNAETAMEALVADGLIEPHVIVGIDQPEPDRVLELTPDVDPNFMEPSGAGIDFAAQIVGRVKPFVDATFATRCGPDSTTIAGFSLGGLMCWQMLLTHPETFGRGICESPSNWWNYKSILGRLAAHDGPMPLRVWMDVGTKERPPPDFVATLPGDMPAEYEHTRVIRETRDLAIDKGMVLGRDLGYYEEIDGEHSDEGLAARMPAAMAFALGDAELVGQRVLGHTFHVWGEEIWAPPHEYPSTMTSTVSFETRFAPPFVLTVPNTLVDLEALDPEVATIDASGEIQSVAPGTASFTGRFSGREGTDSIEVVPAP